jgi:hypothetical protein
MIDAYCASYPRPPVAVTLDIDDTVDVVHGHQQLSLFNAHYDERCFLPIHVYETATSRPVVVLLRPGKTPSGDEVRRHLRRLVRRIRSHWPTTRLTIRGDGHYSRPEVMAWCEVNEVDYVLGPPGNAVLSRLVEIAADDVRVRRAEAQAAVVRRYTETRYGAKSWGCERRVPARIEATTQGLDIRYVVTNLEGGSGEWLYDTLYCARGQAENLIKLHKSQLTRESITISRNRSVLVGNHELDEKSRTPNLKFRYLLEFFGEPLAASWIVTYLPNLKLLDPSVTGDRRLGVTEFSAFGLDFRAPYDPSMQPIPEAQEEVQHIAALYGAVATVNGAATRAALLEALQTSKRIHIATYGRHQVDAPVFQCIYVADGARYTPVHAYELLGLDLRNVDLLTLSACETALGRFDLGDNLRGLPASFFLCGVKTIIGTLWEVESRAAATFFTSFYRAFHGGSGKLDAFADAQRQTRSKFQEFRDWGCFYMSGSID